jgi:hypothetical protein
LLLCLGIPRLWWIRVKRLDTLVSFLTLEGMFHFSPFCMMLAIGLSYIAFITLKYSPCIPSFISELLSWKDVEFYWMLFLHLFIW